LFLVVGAYGAKLSRSSVTKHGGSMKRRLLRMPADATQVELGCEGPPRRARDPCSVGANSFAFGPGVIRSEARRAASDNAGKRTRPARCRVSLRGCEER
jgi:hypothetical protein